MSPFLYLIHFYYTQTSQSAYPLWVHCQLYLICWGIYRKNASMRFCPMAYIWKSFLLQIFSMNYTSHMRKKGSKTSPKIQHHFLMKMIPGTLSLSHLYYTVFQSNILLETCFYCIFGFIVSNIGYISMFAFLSSMFAFLTNVRFSSIFCVWIYDFPFRISFSLKS